MQLFNFLSRLFDRHDNSEVEPAPDFERGQGGGTDEKISHALVLPDQNFMAWYEAAEPYTKAFDRVAVVRSPAGNDLNRYRNITAVEAPSVWLNNNARQHIRRVYPSVVRVDTIRVSNPEQLKQILQTRINTRDRYGEQQNGGSHIDDRFVLSWPSDALPASIVRPFNDSAGGAKNEGIDVYAPAGTTIRAAVSGTVAVVVKTPTAIGYGQYVQIGTEHQETTYLVTQTHLDQITVKSGQQVTAGDPIGVSGAEVSKIVVQAPGAGKSGYPVPDVVDPTPLVYWNTMRLRPTDNGLRIRERPGTSFKILAQVGVDDNLETLEPHGRTLAKVGRENHWINVRAPNGTTGYTAAWFLNAISPELLERIRLTGINLDYTHQLGRPAPSRLGNVGWVRFTYNVSYNPQNNTYGNTDLNQAYNRFHPFIKQYAQAGYQVMVVFTHQTYGEGSGFNWHEMDNNRWHTLTVRFVEMVREIARQYAGQNLIHCYQIWNEQDAPQGAAASVTMPAGVYAFMLGEAIRAIRSVDKNAKIITGGHTGGPGIGANYAAATLKAMPPGIRPDGIAFHPYGRGPKPGPPYAIFGHIDDSITAYGKLMPGKQLWMTEWGVLDRPHDPEQAIADYATDMANYLRMRYPGRLAALIWYAWSQGMHNGYGLVDENDQPRQPLYDAFLKL